ncbi:MAG TPA: YbhB/YbcL family Raf kinase inhibitor-like protein [Bryobacteraceae bacterium]|jgi:Raf kinase inhibitor-like YbhB/YbcL family protein|nr:YbhB/YbcL family Raf kinase inhibitor-like protein [Bryobacteraceae bacterium]
MKFSLALFTIAAVAMAQNKGPARPGLTLTTTAFEDGGIIPNEYTQAVSDPVSPKLEWSHVPAGTVSFVLYMHDPDVARNKTTEDMLHWMVINIPGTARSMPQGVPANPTLSDGAVQLKNGGNTVGFRGPGAPAPGPYHHYTLEIFALNTKLDLGPDATRPEVMKAMDGHILGVGVLEGRFHRP